jgi:hypothetical protein
MILMAATSVVIDPFDGPEIAQLSVAILGLVGTLAVVVISNRGRQHARVSRQQLENEHQQTENPNLREDLDAKHAHTDEKLDTVLAKLGNVEDDVLVLKQGWRTNRTDIDDLMDTEQRRRFVEQRRLEEATWGPHSAPATRRERRMRNV